MRNGLWQALLTSVSTLHRDDEYLMPAHLAEILTAVFRKHSLGRIFEKADQYLSLMIGWHKPRKIDLTAGKTP